MAGYTRQSTGSIINGSPITAPPLNTEFNQLQSAFNATGGHTHTGGTGDAPKINLATSVTGFLPAANGGMGGQNKMDATTTPVVTNDNTEGFAPGSLWENTTTGRIYICVGSSTGAAVWRELLQVQNGNAVLPAATDTVDLGSNSVRFQDLFLSAGIAAAGNATIGGTLNVTAATALGSTLGVTGDTTLVNLAATGTTTITSIDLNSGAIDSTSIGTTTPAAGTFTTLNANTSLVAATADINGGTVDGATIGASTPSTGSFTDLDASGTATLATVDINAGAIDGTVIGASSHNTGKFTTLQSTGQATLATVNIDGGTIDGATVGATTASSGAFTTLTASGGITGALTGNVTGNVTGSLSGGTVTGNVTGDLTGNVTAGSGSSSFNDVTISGTLNMDANSAATITNLSAPTNDNDAARKIDVDNAVANLVDSAPDSLNTLNELAAALADDDDAFNTLNTSIGTKLPKAGGTMTGAIAMSTNKITGVGDPTAAQDVSSKAYTDAQRDTRLATAGGTMSGEVAMGNNKITGLASPVASTDASSKGYVDGVLGSATSASTSATTATTQAGIATTKAGEAANSASAALASEQAAANSYDDFDDRYLGAKASAPTLDNDGDALVIGALYFNSTTNIMNVYGSGGWQSAGSAVNGTSDRQTYIVANANQTVFAATYDAGYIDVYLNGVKQLMGTDVTATNGTSVTFASGTAINDIVDIVAYGTFVLADHLTQAQSDARYVEVAGDTMTGNLDVTGTVTADDILLNTGGKFRSSIDTSSVALSGGTNSNVGANIVAYGSTHSSAANDLIIRRSGTKFALFDGATGDISFYEDQGTTPKLQWSASNERLGLTGSDYQFYIQQGSNQPWYSRAVSDGSFRLHLNGTGDIITANSSGNVGIGATSISGVLTLQKNQAASSTAGSGTTLTLNGNANAGNPWEIFRDNGVTGDLVFSQDASGTRSEYMRISSAGSVGIGITPESWVTGYGGRVLQIGDAAVFGGSTNDSMSYMLANAYYDSVNSRWEYINTDFATRYEQLDGEHIFYTAASGTADAAITWSQAMRLDASGRLLVGKTSSDYATEGVEIRDNEVLITKAGANPLNVRNNGAGGLISFNSAGSAVGSIGIQSGGFTIDGEANHTGLMFAASSVLPRDNSASTNGSIDLGTTDGRWQDLWLSGGVYLGGTGAANKLDIYEEGTWTISDGSGAGLSFTVQDNVYTKTGRLVVASAIITWPSTANTSTARIVLPFTSIANNSHSGGVVTEQNWNTSITLTAACNYTNGVVFRQRGGSSLTNANLSGKKLRFTITYHAA
jgi:hypothetical protein